MMLPRLGDGACKIEESGCADATSLCTIDLLMGLVPRAGEGDGKGRGTCTAGIWFGDASTKSSSVDTTAVRLSEGGDGAW